MARIKAGVTCAPMAAPPLLLRLMAAPPLLLRLMAAPPLLRLPLLLLPLLLLPLLLLRGASARSGSS
jgi:hypothetical protein